MQAITLERVHFLYKDSSAYALENVSLDIPKGSFFALLGENGAGKTTLMRLICGRLSLTSGTLKYNDCLLKKGALDLSKFGTLIENPGDYPRLSVKEYLEFFGALYGVKNLDKRIKDVLNVLEFSFDLNMRVGALSLGNRQKLQIARALIHSPSVLLLDEPAANLDPIARDSLWKALANWRTFGGTLIASSHILPELDAYATHFAVLKRGKIALKGAMPNKKEDAFIRVLKSDLEKAKSVLEAFHIKTFSAQENESTLHELYGIAMNKEQKNGKQV